jgi:hypothetical protein
MNELFSTGNTNCTPLMASAPYPRVGRRTPAGRRVTVSHRYEHSAGRGEPMPFCRCLG